MPILLSSIFSSLGLSIEQAEIYESLLTQGIQGASSLAKTTKVKRTYVYAVCTELMKKGLITQEKHGKTTVFRAQSPDHLLTQAETQKTKAELAQKELESILPTLKSQYLLQENKPLIRFFEGIEGIKKVFEDIYGPKEEPVYGCVDLENSDVAVPEYVINKLIPLRIKNKVNAISFIADSPAARETAKKDSISLRESTLIDKKKYPLPAEIDVYEDKIALLSFDRGQFVGVLIQNQALATSLKSIFKLAFEEKTPLKLDK